MYRKVKYSFENTRTKEVILGEYDNSNFQIIVKWGLPDQLEELSGELHYLFNGVGLALLDRNEETNNADGLYHYEIVYYDDELKECSIREGFVDSFKDSEKDKITSIATLYTCLNDIIRNKKI